MKYNFDSIIDRISAPYQYSSKWSDIQSNRDRYNYGNPLPADRIPMQTADMDFKCPPAVVDALVKTAEHGIFGYTEIPDTYYDAVINWFARRCDWHFGKDDIFPCMNGTHVAVQNCIRHYTEPGDGILLLVPSYGYRKDIEPLGRHEVDVQLIETEGYYTIDYNALEEAAKDPKNTMIILIQPHNPTGRIFTAEEITKIGEICRLHNVIIVSDEVHVDIIRKGNTCLPVMKVLGGKGVISTTAINKTFNTAGLAMTNVIIQDPELKAKYTEKKNSTPFGISAVMAAYNESEEWVDELNEYIDMLIHYSVERLHKELPHAKVAVPEGTYCIWVDFRPYKLGGAEVNRRIVNKHVMLKMGSVFSDKDGDEWGRLCLTSPKPVVAEGLDRIIDAFKQEEEKFK